jgi:hypothetical protein
MTLDLTKGAALVQLRRFSTARSMNAATPCLPPRLAPLSAILAKLDPEKPRPEVPPLLKPYMAPSASQRRVR